MPPSERRKVSRDEHVRFIFGEYQYELVERDKKVSVCICDNHQTLQKKSTFSLMIVPFGNIFVLIGLLRDPEMSPYRVKNLSGDDSRYPPISHQKCLYPNVDVLDFLREILGGIIVLLVSQPAAAKNILLQNRNGNCRESPLIVLEDVAI